MSFHLSGISISKTKACKVIQALDSAADRRVQGVNLEGTDPYGEIKRILVGTQGKTKRERVDALMSHPPMGAETPRDFVARIRNLGEGIEKEDFLKEVFFSALPPSIACGLRQSPDSTTLEAMADMAKVHYAQGGVEFDVPSSVSAVSSTPSVAFVPSPPPAFRDLSPPMTAQFALLNVNAVERSTPRGGANSRTPAAHAPRFQPSGPPPPPSSQRRQQGGGDAERFSLCHFHAKFWVAARQCDGGSCHMGKGNACGRW